MRLSHLRRRPAMTFWIALALLLGGVAVGEAQSRRPASKPATGKSATRVADGIIAVASPNFRVVTDLSEPEAEELLQRLETMLKLVSAYFGKKNVRTIDMYVARDISAWPDAVLAQMDPGGRRQIEGGAGVTLGRTAYVNGRPIDAEATVYAVADHGTPQHEAVHAYCTLAFGRCGPVWYSEGMAEVGQYWRENDRSVKAPEIVLDYLRSRRPKPLVEIVNNPLETTGDSWQNYAWRWALCHLLGFNENYSDRFKPLGLAMLNGQEIGFDQVYGEQALEIQFEYEFFLQRLCAGYRVDLCSWDWKAKPLPAKKTGAAAKVIAARGWQPARLRVEAGVAYGAESTGAWSLAADGPQLTAAGDELGRGRLVGCVFSDYALTEEFEIGSGPEFVAPAAGHLFLRCRDDWGSLSDNKGTITCRLKSLP